MGYLSSSKNNLLVAQNFNELLEEIEVKHTMLIDAIGLLRDYSNLEIVKKIFEKFKDKKSHRKYVYLNDTDDKMIYDGSDPYPYTVYLEDAFYFYSQRNIVGIDFQQPIDMIGILLVNESLDYTDMAQAIYRARKLNNGHVMDICDCTEKKYSETHRESKKMTPLLQAFPTGSIPRYALEIRLKEIKDKARLLELYNLMLENDKKKLESRKNLLYSQTIKHIARTENNDLKRWNQNSSIYSEEDLKPHYQVRNLDIVKRYQANSRYFPDSEYNLHGTDYKPLLNDLYGRISNQDVLKNLDLGISGGLEVTQQINTQTEINSQTEIELNVQETIFNVTPKLNVLYQKQIFTPEQTIDDILKDTIQLSTSSKNQQLVVSYNVFDSESDEFRVIIMSNDEDEIWILSNSTYCNRMLRLGPQLDLGGILCNKNLFPEYEPEIPIEFYPIFFRKLKEGLKITPEFSEIVNYLSNKLQIPLPQNFINSSNSGYKKLLSYITRSKQIKDHTNKCYFMHEIFGEPTKYSTYDKSFIMYKKKELYDEHTYPNREFEANPLNEIFARTPNNEENVGQIEPPVILKPKHKTMLKEASYKERKEESRATGSHYGPGGPKEGGKRKERKERTQNKTRTPSSNGQGIKRKSRRVKKLRTSRKTRKKNKIINE